MLWHIEVKDKEGIFDAVGEGIQKDILDLGINAVNKVRFIQVYVVRGNLIDSQVKEICEELLVDKIAQDYSVNKPIVTPNANSGEYVVEVTYNPGVMDPSEESILKGIKDLGIQGVMAVKTAKKFFIKGKITPEQLATISDKLLYNKLIQHIVDPNLPRSSYFASANIDYQFKKSEVDLLHASDKKLHEISLHGQLFLNLNEMRQIKNYFKSLKRNPTDCELETIAQTWSEHCWHKTFRGKIKYTEELSGQKEKRKALLIDNLLKSTIMKATKELNKPWCVSVFKDNSGVIRFDEDSNVCFKVETHNHPSALEPFGGANTGIGGVIRDPLGTGLGAKPILNTDVFCFGPVDYPFDKLPEGALHPKRVMKGVVSGVRDYGNKMGIPTVNGAVLFHDRFVGNPLVYCGTAGIMPKNKCFKKAEKGDLVVVIGGRTGRDGIHGATFSSGELTHQSEKISGGAVQIGNPIQEKKIVDTLLAARDAGLYNALTDCGAGGLSSAVGEMGQDLGVRVDLDKVPLKYRGLSYTEIWISESQERMVLAVSKNNIRELTEIFEKENAEVAVIGEFTTTKKLQLYYRENLVCDLDMRFLHEGLPDTVKEAVYTQTHHREPHLHSEKDLSGYLEKLLSHYDICSKEWIIRQYDHEVQGGSVLKPLVGIANDGPSDASVVRPKLDSLKGVIVSNGINFRFGLIDPYWMAGSCIDEALRQVIAVGGSLKETAILDNFCWGNPDKPDRLGSLVRASYGCYDAAKIYGVPFISGKDSLYNEYRIENQSLSIPGTLLISAISVMDDVRKTVSMYAKKPGNLIYVVGMTREELGGSHYYDLLGFLGNGVPKIYPQEALVNFSVLSKATSLGVVESIHDCSEGGIAVSAAEMAFSGGLGMNIFLKEVPYQGNSRNDLIAFSESNSRFIVEIDKKNQNKFEGLLKGINFGLIGCVSKDKGFKVYGLDGKVCVNSDVINLKEAWQKPLRW